MPPDNRAVGHNKKYATGIRFLITFRPGPCPCIQIRTTGVSGYLSQLRLGYALALSQVSGMRSMTMEETEVRAIKGAKSQGGRQLSTMAARVPYRDKHKREHDLVRVFLAVRRHRASQPPVSPNHKGGLAKFFVCCHTKRNGRQGFFSSESSFPFGVG